MDNTLLRNTLNYWIVECAGKLLDKSLQKQRSRTLLQSSLTQWQSLHVTRVMLDNQSLPFIARRDQKALRSEFTAWRIRTRGRVHVEKEGIVLYNRSLASGVIKSWRGALNRRSYNSEQADQAQSLFLMKRVMDTFGAEISRRKQDRWIESRRKNELRDILGGKSSHSASRQRCSIDEQETM